jgi:hypothetical protein
LLVVGNATQMSKTHFVYAVGSFGPTNKTLKPYVLYAKSIA